MKAILHWLFPRQCILCQNVTENTCSICTICQSYLPWTSKGCQQCSLPLYNNQLSHLEQPLICGQCLIQPFAFHSTTALFYYEPPITQLINQLKFGEKLIYAHTFGNFFIEYLQKNREASTWPQALIPVPLHRRRLKKRGFNQALEITKFIAKQLKIPLLSNIVTRNKYQPPQSSLKATQRSQNIKQVFELVKPLPYSHVAILDDVMTTGSTVNELSSVLKTYGAKKIEVWCCARAIIKK